MTLYRVEMMTQDSYHNYMMGSNNFWVYSNDVEAETPEEAIAIAQANNPEMVINENFVKTVEEIEAKNKAFKEAYEAERKAQEEKKAKAKATKERHEKEKALALGLTVEEYREKVKLEKKIRNAEKEVARLTEELRKAERYLERLKKEK